MANEREMTPQYELGRRICGIDIVGSVVDLGIIGSRAYYDKIRLMINILYFDHKFFFNKLDAKQWAKQWNDNDNSMMLVRGAIGRAIRMFFNEMAGL